MGTPVEAYSPCSCAKNPSELGFLGAKSDYKVHEEEPTMVGGLEAFGALGEAKRDATLPLEVHHISLNDEEIDDEIMSPEEQELMRAEVLKCFGVGRREPDCDAPLKPSPFEELNVATGFPSDIGESRQPASGWTVFRMLIPRAHDDRVNTEKAVVDKICERTKTEIVIYPVDEVGVVMVSARNDATAVDAFTVFHRYFLDSMSPFFCPPSQLRLTRLIVLAAHAKSVDFWEKMNSIKVKVGCELQVYLTYNISVLSPGDVIIEVIAECEKVHAATRLIASVLREYAVDESMISVLKTGNGILQPNKEVPACGYKSTGLKEYRHSVLQTTRATWIPLHYVGYIIGEDGENLGIIEQSSPASVFIAAIRTPDKVRLEITGYNDSEIETAVEVIKGLIPMEYGEQPIFEYMLSFTRVQKLPWNMIEGVVYY